MLEYSYSGWYGTKWALQESQSLSGRACRRFVRAANLKRKGNSDAKWIFPDRAFGYSSLRLVEWSVTRCGSCRNCYCFPNYYGDGIIVWWQSYRGYIHSSQRWGSCQVSRCTSARSERRALRRPDFLDSKYKYLSWSALGTWSGDLWRRSLFDKSYGSGSSKRFARAGRCQVR